MSRRHPSTPDPKELALAEVTEAIHLALEMGREPDVSGFVARHPELAGEIRNAAAVLTELHDLARDTEPVASPPPVERPPSCPLGRIGNYRIVRVIAWGGMGEVYEAVHVRTRERVALKVLPFEQALDAWQVKRFKYSGDAARHYKHPHIVPLLAQGKWRGYYCQVMQYVDGPSLDVVIKGLRERRIVHDKPRRYYSDSTKALSESLHESERPARTEATTLPPAWDFRPEHVLRAPRYFQQVARVGVQAAEALAYLHQFDHVHRDVKPANLLWEGDKLWLTDFGLVRQPDRGDLTPPGRPVGTLRYMSPEQVQGRREGMDGRSDIYGLGVTLYEMLTLEQACGTSGSDAVRRDIRFRSPTRPSRLNRAIPYDLETIVLKAIEKHPGDRYPTAQAMADDLKRFLDGVPIHARRLGSWQHLRRWAGRNLAPITAVLTGLLVLLSVLAAVLLWNHRRTEANARVEMSQRKARSLETMARWHAQGIEFVHRRHLIPQWAHEPRSGVVPRLEAILRDWRQLEPGDLELHPDLPYEAAKLHLYVACRYRLLGEYDEALAAYHKAMEYLQGRAEHPGESSRGQFLLAMSHAERGHLHGKRAEPDRGLEELGKSIALLEPLVAEFRQALTKGNGGGPALMRFQEGLAQLAATRLEMGNLLRHVNRFEEAARAYTEALRFYRELLERMTGFSEHHLDLAGALNNLALLHFETPGRRDNARALHREARQILAALVQAYPRRAEYSFRLGQTCGQASRLEQTPGRWDEAVALLVEAVRHQREALRLDPVHAEYGENLRETFLALASVQVRLGRHADAARTADQMSRQFSNDWREHCRSLLVLGYCIPLAEQDAALSKEQRAASVDDYVRQGRSSIAELLAEAETNPDAQLEVAWLLVSSPVSQLRDPERALELARRGAKAASTESIRASFLNTLGVANYRLGRWEQARESLTEAATLRAGGGFNDWVFLAMTCWQLQKKDTARLYLARAEDGLRQKGKTTRDEQRFLEEAITLIRKGTGTPP